MKLIEGSIPALFVRSGVTKKDVPYIVIANGMESKFFKYDGDPDDLADYSKGDEIECKMTLDPFSEYGNIVNEVSAA